MTEAQFMFGVPVAFYLGGAAAVYPILVDSMTEDGDPVTVWMALRLALCWPFHPWRNE